MCVAMPGKVVERYEKEALIDFNGNRVRAVSGLVPIEIGDYVLVHAGCILQKLSTGEAQDMIKLFEEIEEQ
ncbi:MAG: HypC/HybG/HupF family hydrogenase formation chaperone [Eubacterium sp.]|nr:HypC/HybG/HupF family hydrogenase formation chaperone [Eubacterium sp.]